MEIKLITSNKKQFLDLLLLADEQESMIDKYLERGEMFALYDDGLKAISVVTCEGEGIYEIKNIAVCPSSQRKGYGKRLVDYLFGYYQGRCSVMLVGTGDTPSTLSFYEHCGFRISHRLKNFFTDNYDHPIYEDGKLLTDMAYGRTPCLFSCRTGEIKRHLKETDCQLKIWEALFKIPLVGMTAYGDIASLRIKSEVVPV